MPAWLVVQATALLTPPRAAAAVSKLGPGATAEAVAAEVAHDAVEEIAEDLGGLEPGQADALFDALVPGARSLADFDGADRRRVRARR